MIRLLPREKYDNQAYRDTAKPGITIRGGGAYYSFTSLSHDYNSGGPDLSLEMGIVRQDTDGSVIIVWKLLKKYPTPKLARNN